jgi:hypothetical protein
MESLRAFLPGALRVNANLFQTDLCRINSPGANLDARSAGRNPNRRDAVSNPEHKDVKNRSKSGFIGTKSVSEMEELPSMASGSRQSLPR